MVREKKTIEFRYYEIPEGEQVLALLGKEWIREYGNGPPYLHFHNYMEIGICHSGKGNLIIDEKSYPFHKGSIVIIPPNVPHTTNTVEGTKAYWEWLYFDIESVILKEYSKKSLEFRAVMEKVYECSYFFQEEEQPVIAELLGHIKREMTEKQNRYRYSVQAYLLAFVVEILRMRHMTEKRRQLNQKENIIIPAMEYVTEHYRENIRISVLAKRCNVSESHFRRIFQEIMNMRPSDYVNFIRIQNACEYLKKTNKSMEEIACEIGFINVSTFNRNFKKILGVSPYKWKKSEQNTEGKLRNYRISAQKGW